MPIVEAACGKRKGVLASPHWLSRHLVGARYRSGLVPKLPVRARRAAGIVGVVVEPVGHAPIATVVGLGGGTFLPRRPIAPFVHLAGVGAVRCTERLGH